MENVKSVFTSINTQATNLYNKAKTVSKFFDVDGKTHTISILKEFAKQNLNTPTPKSPNEATKKTALLVGVKNPNSSTSQKSASIFRGISDLLTKLGKFIEKIKSGDPESVRAAKEYSAVQINSGEKIIGRDDCVAKFFAFQSKLNKIAPDIMSLKPPLVEQAYLQNNGLPHDAIMSIQKEMNALVDDLQKGDKNPKEIYEELNKLDEKLELLEFTLHDLAAYAKDSENEDYVKQLLAANPKLGISHDEGMKIEAFVRDHRFQWESSSSFKGMRFNKKEHGLPRTIDVVKEADGSIKVMVLCKTQKGKVDALGKGSTKSAKVALEWESGKQYADVVVKGDPDDLDEINQFKGEAKILNKLNGRLGIVGSFIGLHEYIKGDQLKLVGYMPIYNGDLSALKQKSPLSIDDKFNLIEDLMEGLVSLDEANIDHRDLNENNVFVEMIDGKPRARVADFDRAQDHNQTEDISSFMGQYTSPDMNYDRAVKDFPGDKPVSEVDQSKENLAKNWRKNNSWGMGLMVLGLISGKTYEDREDKSKRHNAHALDFYELTAKMLFTKQDKVSYFSKVKEKINDDIDKVRIQIHNDIQDPQEKTKALALLDLAAKLLLVDPEKRMSPQDALKRIKEIKNS